MPELPEAVLRLAIGNNLVTFFLMTSMDWMKSKWLHSENKDRWTLDRNPRDSPSNSDVSYKQPHVESSFDREETSDRSQWLDAVCFFCVL